MATDELPAWIFGYGSLVWRPAFDHVERRPAFLVGWARRFWQGSTDHRGTPEAPGRVVTLVREAQAICWGVAYRVAPRAREEVLARLDHREQGGFERLRLPVRLPGSDPDAAEALVYVAGPDNSNYLGPAPLASMLDQIRRSRGPSGSNVEYVLRLADALEELGGDDRHVRELAARLRPPRS